MRLYLIRHPKPAVTAKLCYGGTDVPVESGQVDAIAATLADRLPRHAPLYSSPLLRCAQLARKLELMLDTPPAIYDSRLAEMHFGRWEMQSWETIPRAEIDAWANDVVFFRPGGGESVVEVARRVLAFFRELENLDAESAIVVCHAGTIRLFLACRGERDPERIALLAAQNSHAIGFGECVIVDHEAGG